MAQLPSGSLSAVVEPGCGGRLRERIMSLPPANRRGVIASPLTANGVSRLVRLCKVPGPITVMYTILRPGLPVSACKTDLEGEDLVLHPLLCETYTAAMWIVIEA